MQAEIARCRDRPEAALARISDLGRRPAEHEGGHNPDDTVLIAALGAEVAELRRRIRYCEDPNSRRGMPSLLRGREKRFGEAIARSCRRNGGTGAPIGPPMGHKGRSHRVKAEWRRVRAGRQLRPLRLGHGRSAPVVGRMYREFEEGTNVLRSIWPRRHDVECLACWHVTAPPPRRA